MLESNSRITLSHHPQIIYELQVANDNKISSGQNFLQHAKSQDIPGPTDDNSCDISIAPSSTTGRYTISATTNGEVITKDIIQRKYNKLLTVDNRQRERLFSRIFPELKQRHGQDAAVREKTLLHSRQVPSLWVVGFMGCTIWVGTAATMAIRWYASLFQARAKI